jgi:hypothetical protein
MDTADVVKDLALSGSAHFHASYVAKQVGIPTAKAHEELARLEQQGILEVHFDIICPETDRTIKSYKLEEEIPLGEILVEETGDCEPFELQESDLLVTYSPKQEYVRRLLRNHEHAGSKKKIPLLRRIWKTVSARLELGWSIPTPNRSSISTPRTSSTTARTHRSRRPRAIAQR